MPRGNHKSGKTNKTARVLSLLVNDGDRAEENPGGESPEAPEKPSETAGPPRAEDSAVASEIRNALLADLGEELEAKPPEPESPQSLEPEPSEPEPVPVIEDYQLPEIELEPRPAPPEPEEEEPESLDPEEAFTPFVAERVTMPGEEPEPEPPELVLPLEPEEPDMTEEPEVLPEPDLPSGEPPEVISQPDEQPELSPISQTDEPLGDAAEAMEEHEPVQPPVSGEGTQADESNEHHPVCFNVMQALVEAKADKYIKLFGLCPCFRCRADVIALALSNLPSKYVVKTETEMVPLLSVYESHFNAAVVSQVMSACNLVMKNPRHKR